jgi:hypothetical protein
VREIGRVSRGQKIRLIFTKENSTCQTSINVRFNGVLQFWEQSNFLGFDTFAISKSRGGGYRVSHGEPLKLSSKRRLQGGDTRYVEMNRVSH